ncbi:MAG: hypothetical protein U5L11_12790 [Arhodomonas sp.]|nr:hypothetical protein [Arhodomonas sp.]
MTASTCWRPTTPAGRGRAGGLRALLRGRRGRVEVCAQLGQTDYAAEIAALRNAEPDNVFFFYPAAWA